MAIHKWSGVAALALSSACIGAGAPNPSLPSIFIAHGADRPPLWAQTVPQFFDASRVNVLAYSVADLKAGDYVLVDADEEKTVAEVTAKGATPILISPATQEEAQRLNVAFIKVRGPDANPATVIAGLKALRENAIIKTLSPKGYGVEVAPFTSVFLPHLTRPDGATAHDAFLRWLNLPDPADPKLPSLFLIGDSTVRNGRGDGVDGEGQWGWGDPLAAYFDPAKINVVNRAVGGTGARSFFTQGYWDRVLAILKPGDIVIMQFGHNDNGARGALNGAGDEKEERQGANGKSETVHTFGWYLRMYIADTKAKGATPIVCTLIPRNTWANGKIVRQSNTHAGWARQVAQAEKVPLLDLNELIAQRYDPMGETAVTALFADKRVHTSREGAEMNAAIVISALRGLRNDPTARFQRPKPVPVW